MGSTSSSSFCLNTLNQNNQLFPCKYSLFLVFSPPKHTLQLSSLVLVREHVRRVVVAKLSVTDHEQPRAKTLNPRTVWENGSGLRSLRSRDDKFVKRYEKKRASSVVDEKKKGKDKNNRNDGNTLNDGKSARKNQNLRPKRVMGDGNSSARSRDTYSTNGKVGNGKRNGKQVGEDKEKGKGSKKSKVDLPEVQLRVGLDMCSKRGDVNSAIEFFDWAQKEGIKLGQYHYTVLLYLCSSASVGVVRPAKSGTGSRSLDGLDSSEEVPKSTSLETLNSKLDVSGLRGGSLSTNDGVELDSTEGVDDFVDGPFNEKEKINWFCNGLVKRSYRILDGLSQPATEYDDDDSDAKGRTKNLEDQTIHIDDELKEYARKRGFEIFEKMRADDVPMNEAALTSVARMAMSMGDGDMAFDMVKQMKSMGINPRLRSYGPALSAFCNSGDIDKAFAVEEHMLEHGVYPEEPELQALLRVSVGAGKGDKVYYLLHKLRSAVRKVSTSTASLIVGWFNSKAASRVGKTKWDKKSIKEAIVNGGGGWHGQGWLGRGKWSVLRTNVGNDGLCQCCGEKLAIIDLDPIETESFAESVAAIATEKEKNSSFQKFQKWLDYYGPFEAVVDGANVGLFSQKRFMPSKINAVVNGIRQKLPSKKWPLIVLHNRRLNGPKMNEPFNRALFDKWRNADAIYATPTGSNDDWYWLYAAIKFKSFLVTNDEMRDHTFQLLGNDFFPRWKERHQVRFTFSEAGPEFLMPPPCSIIIQESEEGHWHIPIASGHAYEAERPWLCIMRAKSRLNKQDSKPKSKVLAAEIGSNGDHKSTSRESEKIHQNLRDILSESMILNYHSIIPKIESAEKIGGCTIDFHI